MKHTTLKFGALLFCCVVGWKLGEIFTPSQTAMVLGVILGLMAAIPAVLLATQNTQNRRIDVFHHTVTETPSTPQEARQERIAAMPIYTVINEPQQQRITAAALPRLEVTR